MAKMYPTWNNDDVNRNITGPGATAERHLYKLMRDRLPADWSVLYDVNIKDPAGPHDPQIDFLVFVPGKGVCNVDAKGKGYKPFHTDKGDIVALGSSEKDVFAQAKGAIHAFDRCVKEELRLQNWGAYSWLVAFTEQDFARKLSGGNPYLQQSDFVSANGTETTVNLQRKIEELLAEHKDMFRYFTLYGDKVLSHFTESIPSIERPWNYSSMESFSRDRLDDEQRVVFDRITQERFVHVMGAAGTGKTWIALGLANSFSRQGKRVLYVCFNRALSEIFTYDFKQGSAKEAISNVTVAYYHGLGPILFKGKDNYSVLCGNEFDREKTDLKMANDLPRDFRIEKKDKFDVILVDEAQDLNDLNFSTLHSLLKRGDGKMAIFSDKNQSIFSRNWTLNPDLFETKPVEITLSKNYRNTAKILDHFRPLSGETTTAMLANDRFSTKPVIEYPKDKSLQEILDVLLNVQGCRPNQIVILYDDASFPGLAFSYAPNPLGGEIKVCGYNYDDSGNRRSWKDGKSILRQWYEGKYILKESIQSFKGLEADCVILLLSAKLDAEQKRHLRYVGESRAKYELYIVSEPAEA